MTENRKNISFTEWYKSHHEEEWNEDYALLIGIAIECADGYEAYCRKYSIEPNWDG